MQEILKRLGIESVNPGGFCGRWLGSDAKLESASPIDGKVIGAVSQVNSAEYEQIMEAAARAFESWRVTPAPVRGEVVRQLGNALREHKRDLGALVTLEMGKIRAEGEGEVQEMIDICDFACGLSRQLYGLSMHSERPGHRMYEQWHPLGIVGVISAFNFPVAVWAWNSALSAVCGNATLWKPSSKTPLTAVAVTKIAERVCRANKVDPAIFSLVIGRGSTIGEQLINDRRIPLISATGSCRMGYRIGEVVGKRLGRTILELGGNNAIIVTPEADLDLALRAIVFGAVGTAGQRCTSTRRLIVHESVRKELTDRLVAAYKQVKIGNPLSEGTLMGPLIDAGAVTDMQNALKRLKEEGGEILCGGQVLTGADYPGGCYVSPCIANAKNEFKIVQEETFAPILYIIGYGKAGAAEAAPRGLKPAARCGLDDLDEAIRLHNNVPQGLSSAIFTRNLLEAERFLSAVGSDCGIANVNIGTSGAEIGGAFGGEKETGGGRESGSDSWKAYMRRQTNTINYTTELPLAQGIKFGE
ncbi:MAG: aldehyde dehydrogenase [Phycisphaerae bacterium]|nr:MAG: aldehyde dehydrogenase family protein [Planctomycetia bacterium]RIK70815.1 MAG: aldehyde dehydrogenase family protein [Planctomycetota bacterium]GJQ27142.1 MAG: aldehyde dehydrogenase [Phycisphaerae bacterium]